MFRLVYFFATLTTRRRLARTIRFLWRGARRPACALSNGLLRPRPGPLPPGWGPGLPATTSSSSIFHLFKAYQILETCAARVISLPLVTQGHPAGLLAQAQERTRSALE